MNLRTRPLSTSAARRVATYDVRVLAVALPSVQESGQLGKTAGSETLTFQRFNLYSWGEAFGVGEE